MLFEFDAVYIAAMEMYTDVNITVNVVCVAIVVNKEKTKNV